MSRDYDLPMGPLRMGFSKSPDEQNVVILEFNIHGIRLNIITACWCPLPFVSPRGWLSDQISRAGKQRLMIDLEQVSLGPSEKHPCVKSNRLWPDLCPTLLWLTFISPRRMYTIENARDATPNRNVTLS